MSEAEKLPRVRDLSGFTEAEQQWLIELASRKPKPSPEQLALVRRIFRPLHYPTNQKAAS